MIIHNITKLAKHVFVLQKKDNTSLYVMTKTSESVDPLGVEPKSPSS